MFFDYKILTVGEKFRFGNDGTVYRKLSNEKCYNIETKEEFVLHTEVPTYVIPCKKEEYGYDK